MAEAAARVFTVLEQLAPLELAENWDNVGIIVDPRDAAAGSHFSRALLTVDFTAHTLEEAALSGAELIVAYHPPIFAGLKRFRRGVAAERLIVEAVARGLTIYSPHTALDAARGGMAEWLGRACGGGEMRPIAPWAGDAQLGAGRLVTLPAPLPLAEVIVRIKQYLGLEHVRVSAPEPAQLVSTLAVCPGAGGSLFQALGPVDLLLTGEMRHHDILARRSVGTAVVLTDHSNCERGYLPLFAERLRSACPGLEVSVSQLDAEPLRIV
jgi:dinuclear metal center YbgI/SA1388 family protein